MASDLQGSRVGVFINISMDQPTTSRPLGITSKLWRFFNAYLYDRKQTVVTNGFKSSLVEVSLGVPQRSILGSLLFVIYTSGKNFLVKIIWM